MERRYLLRRDTLQRVLDRNHLTHRRFALHLGLSRSYWSQVFNRHRHLTPMVRLCLLGSRYLGDLSEAQLWDVVEEQASASNAPLPQRTASA